MNFSSHALYIENVTSTCDGWVHEGLFAEKNQASFSEPDFSRQTDPSVPIRHRLAVMFSFSSSPSLFTIYWRRKLVLT